MSTVLPNPLIEDVEADADARADVGVDAAALADTPTSSLLMALGTAQWKRVADFWMNPTTGAVVATHRVLLGVLNLYWLVTLIPDADWFFGERAVAPGVNYGRGLWGLFNHISAETWAGPAIGIGIIAAFGLITGRGVRISGLALAVISTSLIRENVMVWNAGDGLLRILNMLFLVGCVVLPKSDIATPLFGHAGEDGRRTWPTVSGFVLRLTQLQLSMIYLSAIIEKIPGGPWREGTAAGMALKLETMERFWVPEFFTESLLVVNVLTWSTLFLELALPFLLWTRRTRNFAIVAGVLMHAGFDYGLFIGIFSYAMYVCYSAFLPGPQTERLLTWLHARRPGLGWPVAQPATPASAA